MAFSWESTQSWVKILVFIIVALTLIQIGRFLSPGNALSVDVELDRGLEIQKYKIDGAYQALSPPCVNNGNEDAKLVQELLAVQYKIFDPGNFLLNTSELRCMEWMYKYKNKYYLWTQDNYEKLKKQEQDTYQTKQGVMIMLMRNRETEPVKLTLEIFTKNFNKQFLYPIIMFVEQGFLESNKKILADTVYPAEITFYEFAWCIPKFVTIQVPHKIGKNWIPYRHMCRFYSSKLFQHPALLPYKYFWRLDSTSHYVTPINYDIFHYMEAKKYLYGYIAFVPEDPTKANHSIIATGIWDATKEFLQEKNMISSPLMEHCIVDGVFDTYHFWNNFEIAQLDFFTSPLYVEWMDYIDHKFGIYRYRWGDAPIHTVALLTFLNDAKLFHWFEDIGYEHQNRHHCPSTAPNCSKLGGPHRRVNPCMPKYPHILCQMLQ